MPPSDTRLGKDCDGISIARGMAADTVAAVALPLPLLWLAASVLPLAAAVAGAAGRFSVSL